MCERGGDCTHASQVKAFIDLIVIEHLYPLLVTILQMIAFIFFFKRKSYPISPPLARVRGPLSLLMSHSLWRNAVPTIHIVASGVCLCVCGGSVLARRGVSHDLNPLCVSVTANWEVPP